MKCKNPDCDNIGAVNFGWAWIPTPDGKGVIFDLCCDRCSWTQVTISANKLCRILDGMGDLKTQLTEASR